MKRTTSFFIAIILIPFLFSCTTGKKKSVEKAVRTIGTIERLSPALDEVIEPSVVIEVLAEGFEWTEGPVWVDSGNYLLFSDIPPNRVYKWSEADSITVYLQPSGFTGPAGRGGEEGSNGLLIDSQGRLVLCQHGDRRVAIMDAPLNDPKPNFITMFGDYQGKRLNSPNDAVFNTAGDLFITDPPYGLLKQEEDSAKELPFQGVFRRAADGSVTLLTDELSRPNGIGLSPDEKILYVANSDPGKAIWMAYDLTADGKAVNGRVFNDVTEKAKTDQGLPDGLKVHSKGYIFATGPGGVWIFDPDGTTLGIIRTTVATANCAFSADESELYITADMYLLRVKL